MRRRPTSVLAATGLVVSVLVLGPGLTGPAGAADLTACRGKPVTIAATDPGGPATGTPGDDVVAVEVTSPRGFTLSTGAGADTVCLHRAAAAIVSTGDGADVVDTTALVPGRSAPQVSLGQGDDMFVGGPAGEVVSDDDGGVLPLADPGDDVIDTGAGNDVVSSHGGSDIITTGLGDDRVADLLGQAPDRVDLGGGNDTVELTGAPLASLTGGTGTDILHLQALGTLAAIDNVAQTFVVGATTTAYTSFEAFEVEVGPSLVFRGSDRAELLTAVRSSHGDAHRGAPRLDVEMGGGDDGLLVDQAVVGTWDGGRGTDRLTSERTSRVPSGGRTPSITVDLARGVSKVRGNGRGRLTSREDLSVSNYRSAAVTGSRRADVITVAGCRVRVDGGAGRDRINVDNNASCGRQARTSVLHGGAGNDIVTGNKGVDGLHGDAGNDVLKGRGGRDVAVGGPGRDRCSAERRVSC